ncbi:hypothetical protein Cgig2_025712 [Carnegiea gigantea]|uniref:Leucine-rich repeat-containing N-terminal plant-type domain-containing protein n=1 Tax=Carnegiea gigantea TaxID=171969 RepID=A0A9Q1Q5W1_9CARY|nr:hypothetical protein Cgig2_025712 [Carnegiea gigantea]
MVAPFYLVLIVSYFPIASGNTEVKALYAFKLKLVDPNGILQTWDPTLINPCSWDHIECSTDNSAFLVELYSNNFMGTIPYELGNLTKLVTLDLFLNNLTGPIPDTLGNLKKLRVLIKIKPDNANKILQQEVNCPSSFNFHFGRHDSICTLEIVQLQPLLEELLHSVQLWHLPLLGGDEIKKPQDQV